MNEQSLDRVNAFLAAAAQHADRRGDGIRPPGIGRDLEFPDALSTARAVQALIARKRLEAGTGFLPGARHASGRARGERVDRAASPQAPASPRGTSAVLKSGAARYSDFGRAVVDRVVELGQKTAEICGPRCELRVREARAARQDRDEAENRARTLGERSVSSRRGPRWPESNLRTLLATAQANDVDETSRDARVSNAEMEAILGVLKGQEASEPDAS